MKRKIVFLLIFIILLITYVANSIEAKEPIKINTIEYLVIQVSSGDTMWSISEEYRGEKDLHSFMAMIQQLNHMNHTVITEGSYIKVPVF